MILVFGSINMDFFVQADRLPEAGETLLAEGFETSPGGKGANQALAALRSGAKVALVGCAGEDAMGTRILTGIRREGVMTSGVAHSPSAPTGCAFVFRDKAGGNRIVVAPGANAEAAGDQIPDEILGPGATLLMQMELPLDQCLPLLERAKRRGARTILNLAPALPVPRESLGHVDILILNEVEARQTALRLGLRDGDPLDLARRLSETGNLACVVTLGPRGAIAWMPDGAPLHAPALPVEAVDTTGAGDAFCGTLAAALENGLPMADAMRRACAAGSLACMKKGAQPSFPYQGDIEDALGTM